MSTDQDNIHVKRSHYLLQYLLAVGVAQLAALVFIAVKIADAT